MPGVESGALRRPVSLLGRFRLAQRRGVNGVEMVGDDVARERRSRQIRRRRKQNESGESTLERLQELSKKNHSRRTKS